MKKVIHKYGYGNDPENYTISRRDRTLSVDICYPNIDDNRVKYVNVDQESVRASGGIRIHFDYNRNGFVIEQRTVFEWPADETVFDEGWKEVAFAPAFHPDAKLVGD